MNTDSSTPTPFERDERGLVKGTVYHYTPDGRIDWKKMVDSRFLYVANEYKERACIEQSTTLDKLDLSKVNDKWLRITIGGINQLANLRGYISMDYPVMAVSDGSVTVTCSMTFIGNYETDGVPLTCAAVASANLYSVEPDFSQYLATFAENRAFTRCVKRALQINIVGEDEIGVGLKQPTPVAGESSATGSSTSTPVVGFEARNLLEAKCTDKKITFEKVKETAMTYKDGGKDVNWVKAPGEWMSWADIQPTDAFFILGRMDAAEAKAKKTKT